MILVIDVVVVVVVVAAAPAFSQMPRTAGYPSLARVSLLLGSVLGFTLAGIQVGSADWLWELIKLVCISPSR